MLSIGSLYRRHLRVFGLSLATAITVPSLHALDGPPLSGVGDIIPDFTLNDFKTGEPVSREAFAGGILVIDFCASWCGPCRLSAPGLRDLIEEYYLERGGNPAGIPVYVVTVDVDTYSSRSVREEFVNSLRINHVLEDTDPGLATLLPDGSYVPYFAVINGLTDYPGHAQWELLAYDTGYSPDNSVFLESLRPVIDAVTGTAPPPAPALYKTPDDLIIREGHNAEFFLGFSGSAPFTIQWFHDGTPIPGETQPFLYLESVDTTKSGSYYAEVKNDFGEVESEPAQLIIAQRFDRWASAAQLTGADAYPDADPDSDGQSNFVEYVQSTDPSDAKAFFVPQISVGTESDSVEVGFQLNLGAIGVEYSIEASGDLEDWLPVESETVSSRSEGALQFLTVGEATPPSARFWRLNIVDPRNDLELREGETIEAELGESDGIVPYWLDNYGETYFFDAYALRGLEAGVEYTVRLTALDYAFEPYLEFYEDPNERSYAGTVSNTTDDDSNYPTLYTFIADPSIDYVFYASSFYAESTGPYTIALTRTTDFTPLLFDQVLNYTLNYENDHYRWDDFYPLAHTYHLQGLPLAEEVTLYVEPSNLPEGTKGELELRDAHTIEDLFSTTRLIEVPGLEGRSVLAISFVPREGKSYLATVTTVSDAVLLDFDLWVSASDRMPNVEPGSTKTGTIPTLGTQFLDGGEYDVQYFELSGANPGVPVTVEVTATNTDDIRIFIFDASTWEIRYKDLEDVVGLSESLFFVPEEGQSYWIAVVGPDVETITGYTLTVTQGE